MLVPGILATLWCFPADDPPARRPMPAFERIVIDEKLPGGYQVEVADVNGDRKPDIVALGGGTCAWYENPSWTKRIISGPDRTPKIISSATADLDGDGKAEVFIAYEFELNEPTSGKLALAHQPSSPDGPWKLEQIADVGSIHRLRIGDFDGDGKADLAVAPIVGPEAKPPTYDQADASVMIFRKGADSCRWQGEVIAKRPVIHAIDVLKRDGGDRLLTADNLGVAELVRGSDAWSLRPLSQGLVGPAPKRGCSEIHVGATAEGKFLATIDPWHGQRVAIHRLKPDGTANDRLEIDDQLGEGHALWVADVDGDGEHEVFAGDRGKSQVTGYDWDGAKWNRTLLDPGVAAQDLRGADIDGDGTPDFVAVGGKTSNVVWYRPRQ